MPVQLTRARIAHRFDVSTLRAFMSEIKIQVGQVWKNTETGKSFLVTRLFTEALATFAVLRSTEDDTAKPLRIRVTKTKEGSSLPGYVPAQSFESS
jgi:predicted Zn-dependent protease